MYASELISIQATFHEEDRDLSGKLRVDGGIDWMLKKDSESDGNAFPLVILALRAPAHFPDSLLLQLRDGRNSTSALGLYSNVSGRVRLADHLVAFDKFGDSSLGDPTFRLAAIRELFEEVDLDIDSEDLQFQTGFAFQLAEQTANCRVYSANLDLSAIATAQREDTSWPGWLQSRRLKPFNRTELEVLVTEGRANTILSARLSDIFLPLMAQTSKGDVSAR